MGLDKIQSDALTIDVIEAMVRVENGTGMNVCTLRISSCEKFAKPYI